MMSTVQQKGAEMALSHIFSTVTSSWDQKSGAGKTFGGAPIVSWDLETVAERRLSAYSVRLVRGG